MSWWSLGLVLIACAREGGREGARVAEGRSAVAVAVNDHVNGHEAVSDAAPLKAAAPGGPVAPGEPATRAPAFRIAKQSGAAVVERAPLGMRLRVPADSELSLDLVNGARVQLEAGSSGWLLDAEPATVVLSSGALFAQLPPQGSAAGRPALRVVTGGHVLSIAISAEVWLARPAASSGKVAGRPQYLAVLAGVADLEHLPAEAESPIANQQLLAGQAFSGSVPANEISPKGPRTLEQARAAYARLRAPPKSARGVTPDPLSRLESALATWTDAEQRGRSLIAAQRAAKSGGDTAAVQARQSDLVALAQEKLATRQRVRLAYELACERALGQLGDANSDLARFEASHATRVAPVLPSGT